VDNIEWVPIVMFMSIAIVLCTVAWLRYKTRDGLQQTFREALDKGQDLTPEIIDRLGHPKPTKDKDLRLGIIWVAIALGSTVFGFAIPDEEATRIFMGISALPFTIGVAYLILHTVTDRG